MCVLYLTGGNCKSYWTYIRDYYNRRKFKPNTGSGAESVKKRNALLSFLESGPCTPQDDTFTNITPVFEEGNSSQAQDIPNESETEEFDDTHDTLLDIEDIQPPPKRKVKLNHADERLNLLKELVQHKVTGNNEDLAVDLFYQSIAKTVKGLPLKEQMLLQIEVSKLVGNAVLRTLDPTSSPANSSATISYNPDLEDLNLSVNSHQ